MYHTLYYSYKKHRIYSYIGRGSHQEQFGSSWGAAIWPVSGQLFPMLALRSVHGGAATSALAPRLATASAARGLILPSAAEAPDNRLQRTRPTSSMCEDLGSCKASNPSGSSSADTQSCINETLEGWQQCAVCSVQLKSIHQKPQKKLHNTPQRGQCGCP